MPSRSFSAVFTQIGLASTLLLSACGHTPSAEPAAPGDSPARTDTAGAVAFTPTETSSGSTATAGAPSATAGRQAATSGAAAPMNGAAGASGQAGVGMAAVAGAGGSEEEAGYAADGDIFDLLDPTANQGATGAAGALDDMCQDLFCVDSADCALLHPDEAGPCKFTTCEDFVCK